jgi:hypothetical protein
MAKFLRLGREKIAFRCHWEGLGDVNKTPRLNMNLVGVMILECEVDSKQITKT